MLPYHQANEINDRYIGTVLYYGNDPIYIESQAGYGVPKMTGFYVGSEKRFDIKADNPMLRDGPFELGYINRLPYNRDGNSVNYHAVYCTRQPVRQWKQGLAHGTTTFKQPFTGGWNSLLKSPMFKDMLQHKYPSLKRAKVLLQDPITSVAFCRQFALRETAAGVFILEYRGKAIGWSEDGKKFKLNPVSSYLKEAAEANGVKLWA